MLHRRWHRHGRERSRFVGVGSLAVWGKFLAQKRRVKSLISSFGRQEVEVVLTQTLWKQAWYLHAPRSRWRKRRFHQGTPPRGRVLNSTTSFNYLYEPTRCLLRTHGHSHLLKKLRGGMAKAVKVTMSGCTVISWNEQLVESKGNKKAPPGTVYTIQPMVVRRCTKTARLLRR